MNEIKEIKPQQTAIELPVQKATAIATELATIINDRKIFTQIKDKKYVNVEGWQLLGAFIGLTARYEEVRNLSSGNEIKYMAKVSLINRDGEVKGQGVALCSNKEQSKRAFDEYAILSMAQTRAVGKAYRLAYGWVLKLAGYEATPAEEVQKEN